MKPTLIFLLIFTQITKFYCGEEKIAPSTSTQSAKETKSELESEEEETTEIPVRVFTTALQLVQKKKNMKRTEFYMPNDPKIEMKTDGMAMNLCPAESTDEIKMARLAGFEFCLFVKETSTAALETLECKKEVEPQLWEFPSANERNRCGEENKGVFYTFVYQVCRKSKSIILKIPILRDKLSYYFPKLKQNFVEVYTMCLQYQKDPIYVKYTLVPATKHESRDIPEQYPLQTDVKGYMKLDFERMPLFFKKKNQMPTLKEMFGDNFDEHLIPQKLISPKHIRPLLARNSIYTYANVRPQWSSIKFKWQQLEDYVWNWALNTSRRIYIFAGTYGKIIKDDKKLQINVDKFTTLDVPSIWWKLLINESQEGIILAMQNEPLGYPDLDRKLCEMSICNENGWEEINDIAYCCEFESKLKEKLNLQKENFNIVGIFNL